MIKKISFQKTLSISGAVFVFALMIFSVISACTNQNATAKPNYIFKDSAKEGVVAKIGGEEVTTDQLIGDAKLQYLELQKRLYEFKMEQLKKMLEEKLIGAEAKKASLSVSDFIDQKVTKGKLNVSEKEVDKFIDEKKIPKAQVNPQLREKIKEYVGTQRREQLVDEYLSKLTKNSPVEVYFKKPKLDIQVEIGSAPVWGNKDAKVTIVEFSDFQCPFCSRAFETVEEIKKKYKGKVKVAFKHFPLSFHQQARPSAEASLCMNEQSTDKFWKFHDLLFKNQKSLDAPSLEKYAKDAGGDVAKFKECIESKKFADAVQKDMDYGDKLGVRSTPTFFINGELISGAVPIEEFTQVIDDALATKTN